MTPDLFGLTGRVAVVTGGAAGIGRGIAEVLASVGARVVVLDRDDAAATATAEELGATAVTADVRDAVQVGTVAAQVDAELGPLALWVNNAGGLGGHGATPSIDLEPGVVADVVELNLIGALIGSQVAARAMIARGSGGAIVNVSSLQGERAAPQLAAYSASKAAVVSLTRTLALEWSPHAIRVNAVAPAIVETPAVAATVSAERRGATVEAMPLGMIARPRDIGTLVLALGSDLSRYVTGQVLVADGGLSLTTARPHRS